MPKYIFESSETVYYANTIEANSLEEAEDIYYNGEYELKILDKYGFQLDNITEEE